MDKFEKIIAIPSCFITREIAAKITHKLYSIANELALLEYSQSLSELAPHLGITPEQMIEQHSGNEEFYKRLFFRKDRIIFISKYKNVEYAGRDVSYDEFPMDVEQLIINTNGRDGKLITINVKNNLIKGFPLHENNTILIQGHDEGWVNSFYHELSAYFEDSKKIFRNFIYHFFRPLALFALLSLSFLEIKFFSLFNPQFGFYTPLTGLSSIIVFFAFIVNYFLIFFWGAKLTQHLYPYLEFEGKISQKIRDFRWIFSITVGALYSGGLWAIASTLFAKM